MSLRLHSTLSGQLEEIKPLHPDGILRVYVCGMTPKFHPHIGHARVFVAMDVLRRYLAYRGFRTRFVQNFTDVDDKIIQRAASEGRAASTTAQAYIDSYFEVMDQLGVLRADQYPRVTELMSEIIAFIQALVGSGSAYNADGNVYFSVASFADYGKLSHRDLDSQLVAARKELEPGKRDARDFALWKRAREEEPAWKSPWGPGRPGWHIECSAMARETLGDQIDIHGGGADLLFPHHENEIAQTETLTHRPPFARVWAHTGLVTIGGEKMAHSAENFFTTQYLLQTYSSVAMRLYLTGAHYRSALAFNLEEGGATGQAPRVRGIEDAQAAVTRLRRAVGTRELDPAGDMDQPTTTRFQQAMDDDLNTPQALATIFDLARELNRQTERQASAAEVDRSRRTIVHLLGVLGVHLWQPELGENSSVGPFVDLLIDTRLRLREAKQWALADELRQRLANLGVTVEDVHGGKSTWRWRDGGAT